MDDAELELLRQFDLAWQYGPCTGELACKLRPPSRTQSGPACPDLPSWALSPGMWTWGGEEGQGHTPGLFPRPQEILSSLAGITRLQRWLRAEQMGLEPPREVCQLLQTHPGDPRYQCRLGLLGLP